MLYSAIEQGNGYMLQEKFSRLRAVHERLSFSDSVPRDLSGNDFVFQRTSFVFIFNSTKQGQFRGGNALAHEVDVIIGVEPGPGECE